MRILVVGTSNTLVKGGWYDGFQEVLSESHDVQRIALGGAPFSQFLACLRDIRQRAPDHVVLECAANDEAYSAHVGNEVFFDRLYYLFLSSLRSIAQVTVLRIAPQTTVEKGSPVARRQAATCRNLDCLYYDTSEQIITLGGASESAYRDKYHPRTEIARRIGQSFGEWLKGTFPSRQFTGDFVDYTACIKELPLPNASFSKVRIETKLVTEDFIVLDPGTHIGLSQAEFILGFFVNSGETRGILRLDGAGQQRDLFCYFMQPANKNVKRFVPVSNGVRARRVSSLYAHQVVDLALHTDLFHIPHQIAIGTVVTMDVNQVA